MLLKSVSSVGSVNVLLIAVLLIARQNVSSQSAVVECHCKLNKQRATATEVVCTKSKNPTGKIQCTKANVPDVPEGYEYVEPWGLFKLYLSHLPRDAAFAVCRRHGGRLAIPKDQEVAAALGRMVEREPGVSAAFVGIHYNTTEGVFYGDDGEIAQYREWRHGEPGHGSDDDTCVAMTDDGRLDGLKCEVAAPFLCERPQNKWLPYEYCYIADASAFLKVHMEVMQSYSAAQKVCEKDGGWLAVPDTWRRAEAMARLIRTAGVADHVYVGLTDLKAEGSFVTDDNKRYLSHMEFDAWAPGEPDNGGYGYEDCLVLHPNATLADVACKLPRAFLCELPPP